MPKKEEWLDVKTLYGILTRELESDSSSLQYIEPTTYREIAEMLSNLKGQGYDGLEGRVKDSLTSLVTEIAKALLHLRMEKVRRNLPAINYANLTEEERYIVEAEKERHLRLELVLSATLNGRTKVLEALALKARSTPVLVRFIRPVQAIKGVDETRYGPFEQEDVAVLPFEHARSLIEQGAAVELALLEY